ncbi:transposase [Mesorhizobium sp. M1273]|uniref:transposase n=1 Tax=Mesorhizobium sp. M1273 TaxID=2957075 RepID=UPI0033378FD0
MRARPRVCRCRRAGRQPTRRSWTVSQKLAIVREVQESGDPVSIVARRHDMNANHLFIWMKQAQQGRLGRANPVPETPPIAFIDMGVVGPRLHDVEPSAYMTGESLRKIAGKQALDAD